MYSAFDAVDMMTAGPQGLRGSVPIILARFGSAMTTAEFPDPGPDHFAVLLFCSLPR
jgi:hypothetical protein